MKQFEDAKTCLREAWTFSKVDPSIKKLVEQHLKMMKIVCDSVTEITKSDSECFQSHLPFEKVADALVKFRGNRIEKKRVFKIALEYYEKAFARANAEGSLECLADLNNSIAKTYEDLEDFDNALSFYQKQLDLEKDNLKEQCLTYSNIAINSAKSS